ncbi:MAG: phage tail tape measure protein, partial [Lachnospiraceae bacterium]|nr:phage tail tape measure protein [Lachnospiraceae bacterium]
MAGGKEMEIAIKIAGKMESSFNNAMSNAVKKLLKLELGIKAAVAAAGAIKDIGAAAIKTGADFEKSMSGLAATAGIDAGSEQYQRLENAAREMGRATSKSAAESADALQYMALAGWSVEDSIKGLPSILHLSEASGMELARTSDMVTDTMSALGISINELPGYLDVVAKAQNTTNQSAEQLMEAYLGVGGTLKSLGVSTEESATALGVLANRGTKGSEAGTALNAIMVNLTTGAGQAGKAMEALGVSAFDSEGNFIGLKATLEKVNEATKGMTQEERNAALAAIGGKQHLDSLQKLMAGLNDTTADGTQEWAAITEGLKDAGGALEEMRNRKVDNLAGDIDVIKSAASDLGISIYKDINTPLRSAVQLGTDMITELNNAYGSGGMEGMVGAVGGCMAEV